MFEAHIPSCGAGSSHLMPLNTKPSRKAGRFFPSQNYAHAKLLSRNVHRTCHRQRQEIIPNRRDAPQQEVEVECAPRLITDV